MSHAQQICQRLKKIHHHGYSRSELFRCPVCGRETRQNLNYLGHKRDLFCDGDKFLKLDKPKTANKFFI